MRAALGTAMIAAFALMLSGAARAATIVVNSLADPGAAGICALRDAITAANTKAAMNGCLAGTDLNTIQFSITGTIALASTLPQVTDSRLTINGPASPGITIDGGKGVQVMQVASSATLNLENLTIAHGNSGSGTCGGGIENFGTLTVTNSILSANSTSGSGGGICNAGILTVANSGFFGNSAPDASGGVIWNGGTLTVSNSTFSDNTAAFGAAGIYNAGTLNVVNSIFSGNSTASDGAGGGIFNVATTTAVSTVSNSTFSGNSAPGFGSGAGIYNASGTLDVTNTTFSGNTASVGGGISNGDTLTITNSTFSGNTASSVGGGIASSGFIVAVTNSTFSGNTAVSGGDINTDSSLPLSLKATIVAGKASGGNCSGMIDGVGMINDAGYNISDDNSCGFTANSSHNRTDPMLDPAGLKNNGGPTQTIALLLGSPAIDAIPVEDCTDQASPPNPITIDQRGMPRPDAGEAVCDIGAYEFQDFAGHPGKANCHGQSVSALAQQFGGLSAAASALRFPSVNALQTAIRAFCGR